MKTAIIVFVTIVIVFLLTDAFNAWMAKTSNEKKYWGVFFANNAESNPAKGVAL
jgi:hypothetical protein